MSIFTVSLGTAGSEANAVGCVIYIFLGLVLLSTCGHIFYSEVILKIHLYNRLRGGLEKVGEVVSGGEMMERTRGFS